MTAPSMPPEILQMLLDLAEFMERADKPLPIDTKVPTTTQQHMYPSIYMEGRWLFLLTNLLCHPITALFYKILGALAERCAAYAKALHYQEIEFHASPVTASEALISINNKLDLPDSAVGILVRACVVQCIFFYNN